MISILLFGESVSFLSIAGMSLIVAAGVWASISTKREEERQKAAAGAA